MADPRQRSTGRYFQIELASADDGGGIRMTERPKLHLNWLAGERLSEQRKDSGTRDLAATPLVELDSGAELLHSSATSAIERIAGRPIAGIDDGRLDAERLDLVSH